MKTSKTNSQLDKKAESIKNKKEKEKLEEEEEEEDDDEEEEEEEDDDDDEIEEKDKISKNPPIKQINSKEVKSSTNENKVKLSQQNPNIIYKTKVIQKKEIANKPKETNLISNDVNNDIS